ncbi:hypothetical protein BDQ17DRAFT_1190887, partial [Cyathus striatus]
LTSHSCTPNVAFTFDKASFTFVLRVSRIIPKGDAIFLSYIDILAPCQDRLQELSASYGFLCKCKSCQPGPKD